MMAILQAIPCKCGNAKLESVLDRGSSSIVCKSCGNSSAWEWSVEGAVHDWNHYRGNHVHENPRPTEPKQLAKRKGRVVGAG